MTNGEIVVLGYTKASLKKRETYMGILYKKNKSIFHFPKLKKIVLVIFMLLIVGSFSKLMAQESMIPEVSNSFLYKLIDTAKKYYPIVKVNQKKIEMAHINIGKTNMAWFDELTFIVNYSPTGGSANLNQPTLSGVQFGFFVNLGNILQKPYNVKLAKEEYELSKLTSLETLSVIEGDVKGRYIKFVQSSVLLRMQTKIYLEAESVVKEARYKFEKGEVNFETFTKALIYESDNRKQVIDAEANLLIAKASLETIVGKKLSEIH
jgi:outer membrane protein TolC